MTSDEKIKKIGEWASRNYFVCDKCFNITSMWEKEKVYSQEYCSDCISKVRNANE